MSKEMEKIVQERLSKLYEDEFQDSGDVGDSTESDEQGEDGGFSASSLEDFLQKTETKVRVKKEGCVPSPIFGNRDSSNHNKYRVYLENPKGKTSFIFWDSINNTKNNVALDVNDALVAFGRDVDAYETSPSYEEFKDAFGYGETEENLAQKAFNGCRKMMEKAKTMFDDGQLEELKRLAAEY